MKIPFSPPDISELEIQYVTEAMRSGWITTGPKTKMFEKEIAEYCGTSCAVCMNSATAAMEMTLRLLGIGEGDEVITSAYTYTASASVIHHVGAKIVFADVMPGTYEIDPDKLAAAITERTKAVIPVDVGGVMCDYDKIFAAVESKKHLYRPANDLQKLFCRPVIMADAAHSFGAALHGGRSGSAADFTTFSFHAVKNLTTAEGGAVTWLDRDGLDNKMLYDKYQLISLHGQSKDAMNKLKPGAWEYDIAFPGYKCNMTDITAGLGFAQLERFPELLVKRRRIVGIYDRALLPLGVERLDHAQTERPGNCHLYLMRLPGADITRRNAFITAMAEEGIACNVHFKPLPMMTAYKNLGFDIAGFPNAYKQFENEVTLPLNTKITEEEAAFVADTAARLLRE